MANGNGGGLSKDLRSLVVAGIASAAVVIGTPRLWPDITRPDPFTGSEFEKYKEEQKDEHEKIVEQMREEMERRMELEILRQTHRLPPEPTRRRIEALEDAMRELVPEWHPGSNRFSGPMEYYDP